ncbi:winged helix-turn-helix domain-containing protein [Brevundimonas diminuta]|jgi:DNA-binding response OmpR family regulator|uniref:winged helix-turn-helix domain-containing protein n=1 Tax=Brevundimonas diminuta TaxID=293 RepID=UPI0035D9C201
MYGAQRGLELGRHLLLVETRRSERRYLADALVGAGYRVSAVADIQGAARLAEALIFDAIVYGARVPASERERLASSDACLRLTIPQENGLSLAVGCQGRRGRVRSLIGRLEHGLADRPLHRSLVPRIEMGRVSFDLADEFLMADGNRQPLSPMQTFVLRRLALAGGRPLPRAKLHPGFYGGRGVDVTISRLRKLVEEDAQRPRYIRSVHGLGYQLSPSKGVFERGQSESACL